MRVTIEATTELTPFRKVEKGQRFRFSDSEYMKITAVTLAVASPRDCVNLSAGELAWFSSKESMVELLEPNEVTFSSISIGCCYFRKGNAFLKTGLTTAFDVQNCMAWEIETLDMRVEPAVNADLKVYRRYNK